VLVPATGWGLLHAVPVGVGSALLLLVIWSTWLFHPSLPGRWILAALLMLKLLAAAFILVDRGFDADYFANAQWAPPSSPRIDRRLTFDVPGDKDFSVAWRGYQRAPQSENRRTFYLRGTGVTAELWVDGVQVVHLGPTAGEAVDRAPWPAGLRRLTVRLSVGQGTRRVFDAGFIDGDGNRTPLDASNVTVRPYVRWRLYADEIVGFGSILVDGVLLIVLGGAFLVARPWIGIMRAIDFLVPAEAE
jgi:hypothetical protein